ncbi:E3 ubiquitin-protein ligase Zswim2 [Podochytrium sp. JEL0797]|nr:E3 ubiquitin-protein ligase Zswim2 [Podochytrium sp. JEL0797]
MLRSAPYRRTCPDHIKTRIESASKLRLYVVQETGPMAFIVKESLTPLDESPPLLTEESEAHSIPKLKSEKSKSFKVALGSYQSCNCHAFLTENDLCVHILWVMLKVFRISTESEILFQNSLVEREIAELMESRKARVSSLTETDSNEDKVLEPRLEKGTVRQRGIEEGDICEHTKFRHRLTRSSKWLPSKRQIEPRLTESQITTLQNRELTADDYDVLLSLSEPNPPPIQVGITPLHIISTFPTRTLSYGDPLLRTITSHETASAFVRDTVKPKCEVCLASFASGQVVRQIPCLHSFHQSCVDRWLLMQKSTCPTCRAPAFREIGGEVGEVDMAGRMEEASFGPVEVLARGGNGRGSQKVQLGREKGVKVSPGTSRGLERGALESGFGSSMEIVGRSSSGTPAMVEMVVSKGKKRFQPKRLPPLFTNGKSKFQSPSTSSDASMPMRMFTAKAQLEAASSRMSLFSNSANSVADSTESIMFDDLIISRSLTRGSGSVASAAESETGVSIATKVTHSGPSGFKTSLSKRRYLPHTSLSAIEKPPLNLDSLVECHKYRLKRHNIPTEPFSPVALTLRASVGSGKSILPKIEPQPEI